MEIADDSSVMLREENDVALPTLDDSIASALGAAVSEYASVSLTLQKIQDTFADEEAFTKIKDNPDLYMQYSKMLSKAVDSLQGITPSLTVPDTMTQNQIDKTNKRN